MAIKTYKPTTPSRRFMTGHSFEDVTTTTPEKSLLKSMKKNAGRNFRGKITVRHRGGGHKRKYRLIDFRRNKHGVPARVATIEYDPNRTANIALLVYADGEKRYVLAPVGLKVNDQVMSGPEAEIRPGNALPLERRPCASPRARCAWCAASAWPPSGRSATSSMASSRSVRRGAPAGWGAGRTPVARP